MRWAGSYNANIEFIKRALERPDVGNNLWFGEFGAAHLLYTPGDILIWETIDAEANVVGLRLSFVSAEATADAKRAKSALSDEWKDSENYKRI